GNSVTVGSLGTLGVPSGASVVNFGAPIALSGGTFSIGTGGSLSMAPGAAFTFNGGTMSGAGTFTTPLGGTADINGSAGQMILTGNLTFDNFANFNYHPPSALTTLQINSGSVLLNEAGGNINL